MRLLKYVGLVGAFAGSLLSASAFSLLGPVNEAYQRTVIGYNLGGDIGAPKNIGEEYRWNTPVVYYAFDEGFTEYFGTNGIKEVEGAFAFLNALTNTGYSALDPNQFPLESVRNNPRAAQLHLLDLKTATLQLILEETGLTEPDRYVWTLHERWTQTGLSCPFMWYIVIMRNFDPITYRPSAYINGVLYTYQILEGCDGPDPLAITLNFPVDPTVPNHSPITSLDSIDYGNYIVALSRDDAGGLKYLYRTNNVNWESLSRDSEQFTPNRRQAQLIYSSNLWTFAYAAMTNDAPALQLLYPGLIVTGTTNIYTNIWVNNLYGYFTNYPWMPIDAFPQLVIKTNRTLSIQTHYIHTFGNAYTATVTNGQPQLIPLVSVPTNRSKIRVEVQTIAITNAPWMPIDSLVLRQDTQVVTSNGIAGDFFILPTNSCDLELIGLQATIVSRVTNALLNATNSFALPSTNTVLGTNAFFEQNLVTTERNRVWLAYPIECLTTNVATLRQGIDRIEYRRATYDSLIGRFFQPITNYYTSIEVTNSQTIARQVRRVITEPDYLFASEDMVGENSTPAGRRTDTASNFNGTNATYRLAGPGNIEPNIEIWFDRVGPMNVHRYDPGAPASGLNTSQGITNWIWASFDGSTNEPVIYPTGIMPGDVEDIILFQITSSELGEGTVGVPYSAQLEASGGQKPYSWAPASSSAPLPPGLTLTSAGMITGTPTEEGTYQFSVKVTEAGARTTTRTLTLEIKP